jgi:hypothetical protein
LDAFWIFTCVQVAAFTRAGLKDPELVRLDADIKISPDLLVCSNVQHSCFTFFDCFFAFLITTIFFQIQFFGTRKEEKDGMLIFVLRRLVQKNQLTIVFAATR